MMLSTSWRLTKVCTYLKGRPKNYSTCQTVFISFSLPPQDKCPPFPSQLPSEYFDSKTPVKERPKHSSKLEDGHIHWFQEPRLSSRPETVHLCFRMCMVTMGLALASSWQMTRLSILMVSRSSEGSPKVPILQVVLLFQMQLWPVAHFVHSLLDGCNSKATANPHKSEWKKWATRQSYIRKRSTTCKIGTLIAIQADFLNSIFGIKKHLIL